MKYNLVDAQEMHILYSTTFEAPTYQAFKNIKVGDFVKIGAEFDTTEGGNTAERFWCEVQKICENDILKCIINNDLMFTEYHGLSCDDPIEIEFKQVYSIMS